MANCPHCNAALTVPMDLQGQSVQCPLCQRSFRPGHVYAVRETSPRYRKPKPKSNDQLLILLLAINLFLTALVAAHAAMNEYRIYRLQQAVAEGVEKFAEEMEGFNVPEN